MRSLIEISLVSKGSWIHLVDAWPLVTRETTFFLLNSSLLFCAGKGRKINHKDYEEAECVCVCVGGGGGGMRGSTLVSHCFSHS